MFAELYREGGLIAWGFIRNKTLNPTKSALDKADNITIDYGKLFFIETRNHQIYYFLLQCYYLPLQSSLIPCLPLRHNKLRCK